MMSFLKILALTKVLSSMNFLMDKGIFFLNKWFSITITFKKLFSSVGIQCLMRSVRLMSLTKGFPTLITFKRFYSSLKMLMLGETGFVAEDFPTHFTGKEVFHTALSLPIEVWHQNGSFPKFTKFTFSVIFFNEWGLTFEWRYFCTSYIIQLFVYVLHYKVVSQIQIRDKVWEFYQM